MTIPDELVQAAAEALDADDAPAWWWGEGPLQDAGVDSTLAARIALQAAFAKLPECFEAYRVAMTAAGTVMQDLDVVVYKPIQGEASHKVFGWAVLAALAREFGCQE